MKCDAGKDFERVPGGAVGCSMPMSVETLRLVTPRGHPRRLVAVPTCFGSLRRTGQISTQIPSSVRSARHLPGRLPDSSRSEFTRGRSSRSSPAILRANCKPFSLPR